MGTSWSVENRRLLETLFHEHKDWLHRWLRGQRWTVLPADDIVSEVFLALLVMPNLAALQRPRAMMTTIAQRLIYDERRRDDLRRAYCEDLAHSPQAIEVSPEERLIIVQALREIDRMLRDLSPRARSAFLMSQIDGLTYREIAGKLGVSVSMVRNYVAQGLRAAYLAADGLD